MATDTQSQASARAEELAIDPAAAAILDSLEVGLLVAGRDGTIRYCNPAAISTLPPGHNLELVFSGVRILGGFDGWEAELARIIQTGQTLRLDCVIPASGSASPSLATLRGTPFRDPDSRRITAVVILVDRESGQDVTEEQIEVSQRLASLGRLATRVAHELNNPLDGILRYVNLALRVANETSEARLTSYLSESRTGLMRMVQIISELLEFSRTTEGEFDELTINEIVEQAIRNTTSTAEVNGIVVSADFQTADMPAVRSGRLYQVCGNLIKNAIDAMPDGGRLSVTAGIVHDNIVIRVADTGVGLPPETDKVFEPFFTTKEPGKGTGLGLAICKDFIEDLHGTITASPGEEGGAVFTVRIPVSSGHRPSRLTAPSVEAPRDHSEE